MLGADSGHHLDARPKQQAISEALWALRPATEGDPASPAIEISQDGGLARRGNSDVGPDVADLATLHHPSFLHHGCCIEGGELEPLEQVQAAIESDLPSVISGDAASMEVGAGIKLPGKWGARAGK